METLKNMPVWGYWCIGLGIVLVQIIVLASFGQPWIAASGRILLWVNNPLSPDMSQQLADWYSLSHIIHGFIFFWILKWLFPSAPLGARLALAFGIEVAWEIAENTPAVIEAYRQQALAVGYVGDSILNSVSDSVMMLLGFVFASRVRARYVIAIALTFEIMTAATIRDNLTLNVLNFIYTVPAIHDWQAGYGTEEHTGAVP